MSPAIIDEYRTFFAQKDQKPQSNQVISRIKSEKKTVR